MDVFCLLLADLYDAVGDKSGGDTVGDTVTECHEDSGKECRNRLLHIIPSRQEETIMHPTITSTGAVAADGTALTKGARKALSAKQTAVTTEVRPVRPPAAMPAALST